MGGGLRSSSGDTVISDAVDGAGLQTNTTYEQAYALELSRQMLARGAYIYQPANVELIANEKVVNGSNLQVIPLVLFNAALLVFAYVLSFPLHSGSLTAMYTAAKSSISLSESYLLLEAFNMSV